MSALLQSKIKDIQGRIAKAFNKSRNCTGTKTFTDGKPTGLQARFNHPKRKFSKDLQNNKAEEFLKIFEHSAPAYKTKSREGIPIPVTIKERKNAFTKVSRDSTISTQLQAFNIEIGNRTLWTNKKANKSG